MSLTVLSTRVTWVQALALPGLLGKTNLPGPAIGTNAGYAKAITANAPAPWGPAWEADSSYSRFWSRHLRGKASYVAVNAAACWPRLLPLWERNRPAVQLAGAPTGPVVIDRFLFPCGAAIVLTVQLDGAYTPEALLARVVELAKQPVFIPQNGLTVGIKQLLGNLLDDLQRRVFGKLDPDAEGDPDPVSIAVPLRVKGPTAELQVTDQGAVHRLLQGLAAFDTGALTATSIPALASTTLPVSTRSNGATMLAAHRGCAIWSPHKALEGRHIRELICYHRNLSLGSVVVETLLAHIRAIAPTYDTAGADARTITKHAVNLLGLFYAPAKDIWSSSLLRRQIDHSDLVPAINAIRLQNGWTDLTARQP